MTSRGAIQHFVPCPSRKSHTLSATALSLDEWLMKTVYFKGSSDIPSDLASPHLKAWFHNRGRNWNCHWRLYRTDRRLHRYTRHSFHRTRVNRDEMFLNADPA